MGHQLLKNFRILIADDDASNREMLAEYLAQQGARVEITHNGLDACDRLFSSTHPFDLVLMDIQMPVMNGITATARIRADARFKEIPIIAITGGVHADQQEEAIAAGITLLIMKPIQPTELVGTILRFGIRHEWSN
jgi:two-component system sensor histidine kinase/response regulator